MTENTERRNGAMGWLRDNFMQIIVITVGIVLAWGSLNARVSAVEAQVDTNTEQVKMVPLISQQQEQILNSLNDIKTDTLHIRDTQQSILIQIGGVQ